MKTLSDRPTALITGANRGIGLEIARQLCAREFEVFIGARDEKAGREAADELGASFLQIDVADAESIEIASEEYPYESLDVLVNNAGIYEDEEETILSITVDHLKRTLMTNTVGPLLVARAFRRSLANSSKGGRIINLSSGLGQLNDMGSDAPAYSISKTALNAVTRQLAATLGSKGIVVNSVCPGWVRTDMGGENASRSVDEGADTAVWLATDASPEITGQFLRDREVIPW